MKLVGLLTIVALLAGCGANETVKPLANLPELQKPAGYEHADGAILKKALEQAGLTDVHASPAITPAGLDGWMIDGTYRVPEYPGMSDWEAISNNLYQVAVWLDKAGVMQKFVVNVTANSKDDRYLTQIVYDKSASPDGFAIKHQSMLAAIRKLPPNTVDRPDFCGHVKTLSAVASGNPEIVGKCS